MPSILLLIVVTSESTIGHASEVHSRPVYHTAKRNEAIRNRKSCIRSDPKPPYPHTDQHPKQTAKNVQHARTQNGPIKRRNAFHKFQLGHKGYEMSSASGWCECSLSDAWKASPNAELSRSGRSRPSFCSVYAARASPALSMLVKSNPLSRLASPPA